jgi:FkbM family methyltransferase
MSERALPVEPRAVKAVAAAIRALPAGRYVALGWLERWPSGPFWWRLPKDIGGFLFRCDLRDLLMREVCVTGRYEPQETILLQHLLGPGHTFVDVGANWGYFTLVAASLVGAAGRIVSVEADPRACRALAANIAMNVISTAQVVEAAADSREGTLSFNTYGTHSDEFASYGVVRSRATVAGMRAFDVRTRPLDDVLDEAGVDRVDLLKLDIEGAEAQALAGLGRRLTSGRIERILMELHPELLRERGESAEALIATMRSMGFHVLCVNHSRDMHRRAANGSVALSSLLAPIAEGDDLGAWPHVLLTRNPL